MECIEKCPTGIAGFDEISDGGLPKNRATLLVGSAGTGKTVFALETLINGIDACGDCAVFVSFEESPSEIALNFSSLGYDVPRHQAEKRLRIIHVDITAQDTYEAGDFDLEGLLMRISSAIDSVGARRIALDGIENLFASFANQAIVRAEFRRLIAALRDKGVTALITTERGQTALTKEGVEEYIADCVVSLDNRVENQLATRRLRILKYRGSRHCGDEVPFVLGSEGFVVMPATQAGLAYEASRERFQSGVEGLDAMFSGGLYRGSCILVSGTAGSGKSSLAAKMAATACARGEKSLYVCLEESPSQIERNMSSIGIDLSACAAAGTLAYRAARPSSMGLEPHLAEITRLVESIQPGIVVIDPISAYDESYGSISLKMMLVRLVDLFKSLGVTAVLCSLTTGSDAPESTSSSISSLVDTWILLRNIEALGERTRGIYVLKARGLEHSNQIREFELSSKGLRLVDVALDGEGRVLIGSARDFYERRETAAAQARSSLGASKRAILDARRRSLEARVAAMEAEYEEEAERLRLELADEDEKRARSASDAIVATRARMSADGRR
jgi:circadian clock protein KaiC